jgi:hypothetical protein
MGMGCCSPAPQHRSGRHNRLICGLSYAWPTRQPAAQSRRSVSRSSKWRSAFVAPLLEPLDLAGTVVTADAMHTQHEHAEFLVGTKGAHYILVVKKNQPSLYAQLKTCPGAPSPASDKQHGRGHGREGRRTLPTTVTRGC